VGDGTSVRRLAAECAVRIDLLSSRALLRKRCKEDAVGLSHEPSIMGTSRAPQVAPPGEAATPVLQPEIATAGMRAVPSFSVDDGRLQAARALPPEDQPDAPPMRWVKHIHSDDGRVTCGVWDCQAGVFDVDFKCDEVVHILEGEVIVHASGAAQVLRPGDVAFFRAGLFTTWEVPNYVRKLWFHHFPKPTLRERIEYKLRMLVGALPKP
jgi:hypothetical protein